MKPKTVFLNLAQPEWVISSTRSLHGFLWATFSATMSTIRSRWRDWMRPDNDSRQRTESPDRKDKKSCFCKLSWVATSSLCMCFSHSIVFWRNLLWIPKTYMKKCKDKLFLELISFRNIYMTIESVWWIRKCLTQFFSNSVSWLIVPMPTTWPWVRTSRSKRLAVDRTSMSCTWSSASRQPPSTTTWGAPSPLLTATLGMSCTGKHFFNWPEIKTGFKTHT